MTALIQLPSGRSVTAGEYARSWRILKALPQNALVDYWDHFPTEAYSILADMAYGVHDRINRHIPWHGRGRKWDHNWQRATRHAAIQLNQPRLVIHWLPEDLKHRFRHRLRDQA